MTFAVFCIFYAVQQIQTRDEFFPGLSGLFCLSLLWTDQINHRALESYFPTSGKTSGLQQTLDYAKGHMRVINTLLSNRECTSTNFLTKVLGCKGWAVYTWPRWVSDVAFKDRSIYFPVGHKPRWDYWQIPEQNIIDLISYYVDKGSDNNLTRQAITGDAMKRRRPRTFVP